MNTPFLNVDTNNENIPHAILIRAIYPAINIKVMQKRRKNLKLPDEILCFGQGTVTQALGIHYKHNGKSMMVKEIWIEFIALEFY